MTNTSPTYTLDVYGVNYNIDVIENEFYLTASLSNTSGSAYLCNPKRVYAGAHLLNFQGAVLQKSDVQVGAVRAWLDYVENSAIRQHNKDVSNFGISEAFRESNIFTIDNKQIPSQELTIFNWDFDTVTGSDSSGEFLIADITSGSTNTLYGWIDGIIRREYKGLGADFSTSATSFIENEFLYSQKKELPEISYTSDNIFIKGERQINFIKDDDVSDNFYLLEKSMNQIVSEEMLKLFSSIQEFSNLMGRPVDGYRQNYKRLATIREHFFQRVEQDLNLEKFIQYYKWIDGSISKMISQLIPASVNFGPGVTDVIESHILERNKYQRRIGLLDTLESTEGIATGIEELSYNWKYGHAPQENWSWPNEKSLEFGDDSKGFAQAGIGINPEISASDTWTLYAWIKGGTDQMPTECPWNEPVLWLAQQRSAPTEFTVRIYDLNIFTSPSPPGGGAKWSKWYKASVPDTTEWFHVAIHIDGSKAKAALDSHTTIYINGVSASCTIYTGENFSQPQTYYDLFQLLPDNGIPAYPWRIDETGVLTGSFNAPKALEIYNNRTYFDMEGYSDLGNVVTHWRMGDLYPDKWSTEGSEIAGSIGALVMQISASGGGVGMTVQTSNNFNKGVSYISHGNNNCLWRKERYERSSTEEEALREIFINQTNATSSALSTVDKVIYQGSTFAARRLSRPYKVGIDFSDSIHGGINYSKQKNRNWVKEVTTVHGREGASGAPVNVFGIGIGLTDGIDEKQQCRDVYDPNKKDYYNAITQVGRYSGPSANDPLTAFDDYQYKLKASLYWPFNILSGTLNSGYNARIYSLFRETAVAVNLHSDTIDITNEIPMQGPFTETHVGGAQNRHVALNRSSSYAGPGSDGMFPFGGSSTSSTGPSYNNGLDNQYNRPEAWRLLLGDNPASMTPDGAMGFVGPDYGGPYPDQTRKWAIYYREPKAKRPVNISNIQSTTASSVLGNYQQGYEFLSSFENQRTLFRRHTESFLPRGLTKTEFPGTALWRIYGDPSMGKTFWMTDADGQARKFEFVNNSTYDGSLSGVAVNIGISNCISTSDWAEINRRFCVAVNGARELGYINMFAEMSASGLPSGELAIKLTQGTAGAQGNTGITPVSAGPKSWEYISFSSSMTGYSTGFPTALNQTTNYMTLVGQAPYMSGNVFGVPNNNRQPTTDSVVRTTVQQAFMHIHFNQAEWNTNFDSSPDSYNDAIVYINRSLGERAGMAYSFNTQPKSRRRLL